MTIVKGWILSMLRMGIECQYERRGAGRILRQSEVGIVNLESQCNDTTITEGLGEDTIVKETQFSSLIATGAKGLVDGVQQQGKAISQTKPLQSEGMVHQETKQPI